MMLQQKTGLQRRLQLLVPLLLLVTLGLLLLLFRNRRGIYLVTLSADDQSSVGALGPFNGTLAEPRQFYMLLHQHNSTCRKLLRIGGSSCNRQPRAQAELCMDAVSAPPSSDCVVYSFGQDSGLAFEEQLLLGRNCTVHMFDPTIQAESPIPIYLSGQEFQHAVGRMPVTEDWLPRAGGSNINWEVVRTLLTEYGPTHPTIHVLKLDLHGAEWEALSQLSSLGLMSKVQQLSLGLHTLHLKNWPYNTWLSKLQHYQDLLEGVAASGLRQVTYREDVGNLALVQMPGENLPRQACGRALFVRSS